ncbi:MAG: hypothetical protein J6V07_05320, partial [Clostridia bacterium]|nr:hypothetical protein [Clostridia bacterium]
AFLSHIPGMRLYAPATLGSLRAVLRDSLTAEGPLTIRYENRADDPAIVSAFYPDGDFSSYGVRPDFASPLAARDGIILTYGAVAAEALRAKAMLAEEGLSVGVILLECLKPYGELAERLLPYVAGAPRLLFLEEGIRDGGAGMLLLDRLRAKGLSAAARILAIDDHFADPDSPVTLREHCHISADDVAEFFRS